MLLVLPSPKFQATVVVTPGELAEKHSCVFTQLLLGPVGLHSCAVTAEVKRIRRFGVKAIRVVIMYTTRLHYHDAQQTQ
jgi:hypothetical protein